MINEEKDSDMSMSKGSGGGLKIMEAGQWVKNGGDVIPLKLQHSHKI